MIEVLTKGMRDNVVAITAHGKVDHDDYQKVIVPEVEKKLKTYPKVRLLYHLGPDFDAYSMEALWDDAKLGMHHRTDFEKAAVVTNVEWIRNAITFFRFMIPCPTRLFRDDELSAATEWINA